MKFEDKKQTDQSKCNNGKNNYYATKKSLMDIECTEKIVNLLLTYKLNTIECLYCEDEIFWKGGKSFRVVGIDRDKSI